MVRSLVDLCAQELVRDHGSLSPCWLTRLPRELFKALLEAAFSGCRPLSVAELVSRWPWRSLSLRVGLGLGLGRTPGRTAPNKLCIQALLLAVVRGLSNPECSLQILDLCGVQGDEGATGEPMGGWSLTVALCSMVTQAHGPTNKTRRRNREQERRRFSALEQERDVKKERGEGEEKESNSEAEDLAQSLRKEQNTRGVRRRRTMQPEMKTESAVCREEPEKSRTPVEVVADLFVNARSLERLRGALSTSGPLKLRCRYLRVEEISVSNIKALLHLLPHQSLLGVDIRYSSLGVDGLAELLPVLAAFPAINSLRLHYCNLNSCGDDPGQEDALRVLSLGLAQLHQLRRLSLTALRLPGRLQLLLSSLPRPLKILELPYLSLSPPDLTYLSSSHHAPSLQQLDLSENCLDDSTLPSVQHLLVQASSSLQHLTLSGCGLNDGLLHLLLPSLAGCVNLRSLALALNPMSMSSLVDLVRVAVKMPSLRQVLYPNPLENYCPGLPLLPSSAQLLDWPLDERTDFSTNTGRLNRMVLDSGRSDLFLTCDLLNYDQDLVD